MCLYSICDNNSFLNSNSLPIRECIEYLKKYFNPNHIEDGFSLAILGSDSDSDGPVSMSMSGSAVAVAIGKETMTEGSRLTHSHSMQYQYVLQSLELWSAIIDDMYRLWYLSEQDLLGGSDSSGSSSSDSNSSMKEGEEGSTTTSTTTSSAEYELVNLLLCIEQCMKSWLVLRSEYWKKVVHGLVHL